MSYWVLSYLANRKTEEGVKLVKTEEGFKLVKTEEGFKLVKTCNVLP